MTVGELLQRMQADEFERWKILEGLDPWGQRRDDWRIALLSSQVAAIAGAKKRDGYSFKAIDCILEFNTDLPEDEDDDSGIDASVAREKRASEIERQVLKMFGVGGKQNVMPTKKVIQEHDKPKGK